MKNKSVQIFGFIMSFAYVFFGLLIILSDMLKELIADRQYRILFGGALLGYGLFRVRFFFIQLRKKK